MSGRSFLFIIISLCVKQIKCFNKNDSNVYDIQGEIIEEFKRLCPYTDMCLSAARNNLTEESNGVYTCCRSCNCEITCGNACCPDKPEHFLNDSEINELNNFPEQCVFAQIRKFDPRKLNGKSYKMIGICPINYSNRKVNDKCLRHYHDFDFEKDDFKTLMPVTAEIGDFTFRNYYCAICHNALNKQLHFWSTKALCKNKKKLLLTSLSEIPAKLSEDSSCQVIFEPSFSVSKINMKVCGDKIERCNVTGNWKYYDRSIEIACLSYTSEYYVYKNIHCFLCNGHTIKTTSGKCQPDTSHAGTEDSIFTLLDFYSLIGSIVQQQETNCPDTFVYDPFMQVCRQLFCATGMMLNGNKCIPQYPDNVYLDTTVGFSLHFDLVPSHIARQADFQDVLLLIKSLSNDIRSKINMVNTAEDAKICDVNANLKMNDSLDEIVTSMAKNNLTDFVQFISHIPVQVDFMIKGIENISAVLEEMVMLFTSNDFHAQYRIQYSADDRQMRTKDNASFSEEYIKYVEHLDLDASESNMLLNGHNDPYDGLGILWFSLNEVDHLPIQTCDSALTISPYPFCPKIELHRKEFEIDVLNHVVVIAQNDNIFTVTFTKMLTTVKDDNVIVCADEYISKLDMLKVYCQTDDELKVLSLICFACSVLSLALTFVIYCIFPELRTLPGLNTMTLVLHLFFEHTFMIVAQLADVKLSWLCSVIGLIIHYNLLASFFWMFICTLHMLKVFVKIYEKASTTPTKRTFIQYLVFSETLSGILVISNIIAAIVIHDDSDQFGYGGTLCFMKFTLFIIYFIGAPLCLVLLANIGMFGYVMWRVFRLPDMTACSNKERHTVVILAKLSSLTGITWILDFFPNSILVRYAFTIFIAGQGVFIMMSFVMNRRVSNLLRSRFRTKPNPDKNDGSTHSGFLSVVSGNETSVQK